MACDFLKGARRGPLVLVEWNRHKFEVSGAQARGDKFERDVAFPLNHEASYAAGG